MNLFQKREWSLRELLSYHKKKKKKQFVHMHVDVDLNINVNVNCKTAFDHLSSMWIHVNCLKFCEIWNIQYEKWQIAGGSAIFKTCFYQIIVVLTRTKANGLWINFLFIVWSKVHSVKKETFQFNVTELWRISSWTSCWMLVNWNTLV